MGQAEKSLAVVGQVKLNPNARCKATVPCMTSDHNDITQLPDGTWSVSRQINANRVLTKMTTKGKMANCKDVIDLKSDDHLGRTLSMLADDGKWHESLKAN